MPNSNGGVIYFMVETCDFLTIRNNVFKEYFMPQENNLHVILREISRYNLADTTYVHTRIDTKKKGKIPTFYQ